MKKLLVLFLFAVCMKANAQNKNIPIEPEYIFSKTAGLPSFSTNPASFPSRGLDSFAYIFYNRSTNQWLYWNPRTRAVDTVSKMQAIRLIDSGYVNRTAPLDSVSNQSNGIGVFKGSLLPQRASQLYPGLLSTDAQSLVGSKYNGFTVAQSKSLQPVARFGNGLASYIYTANNGGVVVIDPVIQPAANNSTNPALKIAPTYNSSTTSVLALGSVSSAGSGLLNGTFSNLVTSASASGTDATVTVTVAGNIITSVVIGNNAGVNYANAETLTFNLQKTDGTTAAFTIPVASRGLTVTNPALLIQNGGIVQSGGINTLGGRVDINSTMNVSGTASFNGGLNGILTTTGINAGSSIGNFSLFAPGSIAMMTTLTQLNNEIIFGTANSDGSRYQFSAPAYGFGGYSTLISLNSTNYRQKAGDTAMTLRFKRVTYDGGTTAVATYNTPTVTGTSSISLTLARYVFTGGSGTGFTLYGTIASGTNTFTPNAAYTISGTGYAVGNTLTATNYGLTVTLTVASVGLGATPPNYDLVLTANMAMQSILLRPASKAGVNVLVQDTTAAGTVMAMKPFIRINNQNAFLGDTVTVTGGSGLDPNHPVTTGSSPTVINSAGSAISSISVSGTDANMKVSFTIPSGQTINGYVCTVTYASAWSAAPKAGITPSFDATNYAAIGTQIGAGEETTNTFKVRAYNLSAGTYIYTIKSAQ